MQAQAASAAELAAVRQELQGATEMLDSMQQMASSSMEGQEQAQQQMDALTAQLQAAIQVCLMPSEMQFFVPDMQFLRVFAALIGVSCCCCLGLHVYIVVRSEQGYLSL